jgi:hypothetical protein
MPEQLLCPGSEYILYVNRDCMRFGSPARDVHQQEHHTGIQSHAIEEVPTASRRVIPRLDIEALDFRQVDWKE